MQVFGIRKIIQEGKDPRDMEPPAGAFKCYEAAFTKAIQHRLQELRDHKITRGMGGIMLRSEMLQLRVGR
ncbi:MAG TPA: hypothetical protein PKW61_06930, partial [Tenuifilaceae bacterium]|nr:hypothetical protein [Tenuifilaceae bacterium]